MFFFNVPGILTFSSFILSQLQNEPEYDPFEDRRQKTVGEKEDEYRQRRRKLVISPERVDPFADGKFQFNSSYFNYI